MKSGSGQTCTFFTIPFANLRGNAMRTFLGKSDFYWPLMVLAEQWQCSLYANVPSVQNSVPTMFPHFLQTDGLQTDGSSLFRLNCETITVLFSQILANFQQMLADFCRALANFSRFLAKETPEFLSKLRLENYT